MNKMRSPEVFEFSNDELEHFSEKNKSEEKDLSPEERSEITNNKDNSIDYFAGFPYLRFPLIAIPVIRGGHVHAHLYIFLAMKAIDEKSYTRSNVLMPRLIDGIYSDLYKAFENLWNERSDPKISIIKERILAVTEKILGKNQIETIYIREIIFKRIKS